MDKQLFSISEISDNMVQYSDMYLKKVIINAKLDKDSVLCII